MQKYQLRKIYGGGGVLFKAKAKQNGLCQRSDIIKVYRFFDQINLRAEPIHSCMTYYLRIFIVNLNDLKIIKTWMLKHRKARQKVDPSFAYFIIS
jgi:hypothetical protein